MEFTRTGKRKRASYEMVAAWVNQSWKQIPGDIIVKGLNECGYIEWNGSLDVLHSRLKDTNREQITSNEPYS